MGEGGEGGGGGEGEGGGRREGGVGGSVRRRGNRKKKS